MAGELADAVKKASLEDKSEQHVETAPDPDEDELDDLDDVLDEFQKPTITQPKPTAPAATTSTIPSGPGRPTEEATTTDSALPSDDELAAQLQAGMSNLISELDSNPDMKLEFEKMMQELIAAGNSATDKEAMSHIGKATDAIRPTAFPDKSTSSTPSTPSASTDFQSTIRKTMDRMKASEAAATTAASSTKPFDESDLLAQMMKELGDAGMGGDGEADFNSMLMNMMAQLTHKEILYEPMKELHDKFPGWMAENREKVGQADRTRYEEQQKMVGEIVGRFERKGYSDDNEEDREYIVERMQKMQAAGAPPPDLVGDMSAAQEALGDLESGCPTQ